jgi:integrase
MSVRKRRWKTGNGEVKEAWVVDYADQHGDRHLATFERKKEADDHWATVKVDVRKGIHTAPSKSPTVAEAAEKWISKVEANGMREDGPAERSTISQYRQHINLHIVPRLGRYKMAELTTGTAEKFRDELLKGPDKLSRPLARKVLTSFKSLCKTAGYSHVVATVSIGKEKRQRGLEVGRDIPSIDEVKRLLESENDLKRRALLLTVAFTGLRASELRGLRWKDIDTKAGELHVRQRADRYNNVGAPKSSSSIRTIPLDDKLLAALKTWRVKSEHKAPDAFVFCTSTGRIEHHANMLRSLEPTMKVALLLKKDGTPKYGLHAFRHFFASWCINSKESGGRELAPLLAQRMLGHSTISMTYDIYGHLFPGKGDRSELNAAVRQLLA